MKYFNLLFFIGLSIGSFAQINVKVSGNIFNPPADKIYISHYVGQNLVDDLTTSIKKDGNFEFVGKVAAPDYYVLRVGTTNINIVLRDNSDIKIYGDGKNLNNFVNIVNSEESSNMYKFLKIVEDWKQLTDSANMVIKSNPAKQPEIANLMKAEQQTFLTQQRSFVGGNQNSPALIAAINTIDIQNDFAGFESIVTQLTSSFSESPTVQSLQQNYEVMKQQRMATDKMAPGNMAPDFEELMVDGETKMKLSDLRGKVVLLDFWASWCGPCRRDNPHVVGLYEKYKDRGFTVMSVSLDKSKDNWIAAIEKDNLSWPNHVSDLQQWSSRVGRIYGVSSIPFTVLIDKEGKIVQTKLRGEALTAELERLLGK